MKSLLTLMLVAVFAFGSLDAEAARRMGGGKSLGQQSSNVTQRSAAPAAPAAPTQNAANAAPKPATPAAAAPKKPWGAMLGGLAAGLGLAWLASSLGLGAAFGQFLMFALLALVVMVVVGMVMRARKKSMAPAAGSNLAFEGAGGAPAATLPRQYSPDNVGNDASARPWERSSTAFEATKYAAGGAGMPGPGGSMIGSALGGSQSWGIPADFDTEGFLTAARRNFVTLQDAWDRSDIERLRSMMTDGMLAEIKTQLSERESHTEVQVNKTEVVMLDAKLLGIEDLGENYLASVEFNGMIREDVSAGPSPFREVWNMSKAKSGGSGWLVAGVQALQ